MAIFGEAEQVPILIHIRYQQLIRFNMFDGARAKVKHIAVSNLKDLLIRELSQNLHEPGLNVERYRHAKSGGRHGTSPHKSADIKKCFTHCVRNIYIPRHTFCFLI